MRKRASQTGPIHPEHGCVVEQEAKDRASNKTSNIQLAYAYIRHPEDCEPTMILTWLESFTGLAGNLITTEKGPTAQQLDAVVTFIREQGLTHSTLQCEGEPALVKLIEELGKQTNLPTSKSLACSQQLRKWQKTLFAQFRALLSDFCHRYKLQPCTVEVSSSLGQYMLRHAVWLFNRFHLHDSDNQTSLQRRWSTTYCHSVLPFGELVLAQDQNLAFWLGRCEPSDEHILATPNSSSLVTSSMVTRLSLKSSKDFTLFKSLHLPPPELASDVSFHQTPELTQPPLQQACPYELSDLAWQQPALHHAHVLQQMAFAPTNCATASFSNDSLDRSTH